MTSFNTSIKKKDSQENKIVSAYEVMEVVTQTCYAGTQVFYLCRPLFRFYTKDYSFKEPEKRNVLTDILHGEKMDVKFREDEVRACAQEIVDIIKSLWNSAKPLSYDLPHNNQRT